MVERAGARRRERLVCGRWDSIVLELGGEGGRRVILLSLLFWWGFIYLFILLARLLVGVVGWMDLCGEVMVF